jgi:predicted nucleotidyltransferase
MQSEPLLIVLADAVSLLESQGVAYALIGGLAITHRGRPRSTDDVDLVIAADIPWALRFIKVLAGTDFRPLLKGVEEVVEKSFILPLLHLPTNIKLDLVLGLSGFEQEAIERAERVEFGGKMVFVATAEDLLIMKTMAGRPQDDQDVHGLVVTQRENIDWDYCLRQASRLEESLAHDLVGRIIALRDG